MFLSHENISSTYISLARHFLSRLWALEEERGGKKSHNKSRGHIVLTKKGGKKSSQNKCKGKKKFIKILN